MWASRFAHQSQQDSRRTHARLPDSGPTPQAAKSIFVIGGGSCFSSILPWLLILASSIQFRSDQHGKACPIEPGHERNRSPERSVGFVKVREMPEIHAQQV